MQLLQSSSPGEVFEISPWHFVVPARLDLVVKYRFFRFLDINRYIRWLVIYNAHIEQRTGGAEPRSSKETLAQYREAAADLLRSMKQHAFLAEYPVVLGSNLNLMGGAHRIACALYLGQNVHVTVRDKPGNAALWDEAFMRSRGMDHDFGRHNLMDIILKKSREMQDAARLRIG